MSKAPRGGSPVRIRRCPATVTPPRSPTARRTPTPQKPPSRKGWGASRPPPRAGRLFRPSVASPPGALRQPEGGGGALCCNRPHSISVPVRDRCGFSRPSASPSRRSPSSPAAMAKTLPPSPRTRRDPLVQPLIVTDDTGVQVEIAAPPRRIVAALPSVTYLLLDLGLGDRIVASDNFSLEAAPEMGDVPQRGRRGLRLQSRGHHGAATGSDRDRDRWHGVVRRSGPRAGLPCPCPRLPLQRR